MSLGCDLRTDLWLGLINWMLVWFWVCHLLRTKFSRHMGLFHWQPAPHQHIMDFGKIYFKVQKSPYLHKMTPKPTIQNPWQYYLIKAHGSSSWHNISFSTNDPNSWISSRKFWELWFGEPRNMFSKAPAVQSW